MKPYNLLLFISTVLCLSCSSADDVTINNSQSEAIKLSYDTRGIAFTRANSSEIPAADDFAANDAQKVKLFFKENSQVSNGISYKSSGYTYIAYNGKLTISDNGSEPYWSDRTVNTDIFALALYPADVVNEDKFLTATENDFTLAENALISHVSGNISNISSFDGSSYGVKIISVPTDQSNYDNYRKADVLIGYPNESYTTTMIRPTSGTNKIYFRHGGNKITLKIEVGDGVTTDDFIGATVELLNWPICGAIKTNPNNNQYANYFWFTPIKLDSIGYKERPDKTGYTKTLSSTGKLSSSSFGSVIKATDNLDSTLTCSAIVPNHDVVLSDFGFCITTKTGAQYAWHFSDNQYSAGGSSALKPSPGQELEITLKINNSNTNNSATIKASNYVIKNWEKIEYAGAIG
jgi:hypothetical protein